MYAFHFHSDGVQNRYATTKREVKKKMGRKVGEESIQWLQSPLAIVQTPTPWVRNSFETTSLN